MISICFITGVERLHDCLNFELLFSTFLFCSLVKGWEIQTQTPGIPLHGVYQRGRVNEAQESSKQPGSRSGGC